MSVLITNISDYCVLYIGVPLIEMITLVFMRPVKCVLLHCTTLNFFWFYSTIIVEPKRQTLNQLTEFLSSLLFLLNVCVLTIFITVTVVYRNDI